MARDGQEWLGIAKDGKCGLTKKSGVLWANAYGL